MVKVQIMSKNGHDEKDMPLSSLRGEFPNHMITCQMNSGQQLMYQEHTQINEEDVLSVLVAPCLTGG